MWKFSSMAIIILDSRRKAKGIDWQIQSIKFCHQKINRSNGFYKSRGFNVTNQFGNESDKNSVGFKR